ncbi:MAG: hypothetical protein LBN40_00925 [Oscillospiraceae bacterium]|nr:hypothetical protein [Oscillospiraceae bacterium]
MIKNILISVVCASLAVLTVIDGSGVITSVKNAAYVCLDTIVPSLFGFMFISTFLLNSGAYRIVLKPFCFLLRPMLKMSDEQIAVFLLSVVGGYPVGVKLLSERDYPKKTSEKMLGFCYCGGPLFLSGIIGASLFGDTRFGLYAYAANVAACFTLALFYKESEQETKPKHKDKYDISIRVFASSVTSAGYALFPVCFMILAFNSFIELTRFIGVDSPLLYSLMEISNIKNAAMSLPVAAAVSSFGGVCIVAQVAALCEGKFSLTRFLLMRIPAAALSAVYTLLLMKLLGSPTVAAIARVEPVSFSSHNIMASLFLVLMCGILVADFSPSKIDKQANK